MMSFNRRELLGGGVWLGGLLLLANHAEGNAADTDKLFGLVEISSSGITTSIFHISAASTTEQRMKLSGFQRLEPTKSGSPPPVPLPLSDDLNAPSVAATIDKIAERVDQLVKLKVRKPNIYVAMSSGAAERAAPVLESLRRGIHSKTGLKLAIVTAREEARLQFDWVVAPYDRGHAFQIDIGSGNTKGGSYDRRGWKGRYSEFAIPFGTKTLAAAVKERWPDVEVTDFPARTREFYAEAIAPLVARDSGRVLGSQKNPRVILSGGAVWAAMVASHPREIVDGRNLIELSTADLDQVIGSIQKGIPYGTVPTDIQGDDRKALLKLRSNVRNIFNPHQIAAGVTLLSCLGEQLAFKTSPRIVFPTFSGNTWSYQYLLESSFP